MGPTITFENFRCFGDVAPTPIDLGASSVALVGLNNSGKSSILRFFFEARSLFRTLSSSGDNVRSAFGGTPQEMGFFESPDPDEIFTKFNSGDIRLTFAIGDELGNVIEEEDVPPSISLVIHREMRRWTMKAEIPKNPRVILKPSDLVGGNVAYRRPDDSSVSLNMGPYRSLFQMLCDSMYIGPVRHVSSGGGAQFDISIGHEVIRKWHEMKAGPVSRDHEKALTLERELATIFGFQTLEINAAHNMQELNIFINKKSYFLQRLGSGISQFVAVLVNLMVKRPQYIFIDEPELNLHPSLQLEFLRQLYSRAQRGVVFATHSIGLARDAADRIYSFKKKPDSPTIVSEHLPPARLSEILGEMSYRSLREMAFRKVLLVEGPTEVKVFKSLLSLYDKGREILLIPLGGGSMINGARRDEIAELVKITGSPQEIEAIVDSERAVAGAAPKVEHTEFAEICAALGVRCTILERRAIENYSPLAAVQTGVGPQYRELLPFERLEDVNPKWKKRDNWRVAESMTRDMLAGSDLDLFLQAL